MQLDSDCGINSQLQNMAWVAELVPAGVGL
jgi:hypothetical protein